MKLSATLLVKDFTMIFQRLKDVRQSPASRSGHKLAVLPRLLLMMLHAQVESLIASCMFQKSCHVVFQPIIMLPGCGCCQAKAEQHKRLHVHDISIAQIVVAHSASVRPHFWWSCANTQISCLPLCQPCHSVLVSVALPCRLAWQSSRYMHTVAAMQVGSHDALRSV